MSDYQRTNGGWILQQTQRHLSEWLRRPFSGNLPESPPPSHLPDGLVTLLNYVVPGLAGGVGAWLVIRYGPRAWRQVQRWWIRRQGKAGLGAVLRTHSVADWQQQADLWYHQGNYREACRCLYLAMLQHLHEAQVVYHQPSRTDGEHRSEISALPIGSLTPDQRQPCLLLINTHEQLCFNPESSISLDQFEQCRQALHQLQYPSSALTSQDLS